MSLLKSWAIYTVHLIKNNMLICGRCNPPPVDMQADPSYRGVYLNSNDNLQEKAMAMKGTPLRVEHNTAAVGSVLSSWIGPDQCMYALAEIDVSKMGGAVAAACVKSGRLAEFSLGYKSRMIQEPDGNLRVGSKTIQELSIVANGARPDCRITHKPRML